LLPLVYGELLAKSGRLQRETMPRHKETPKVERYRQDEIKHEFDRRRLTHYPQNQRHESHQILNFSL
jgi:hypothetical protein